MSIINNSNNVSEKIDAVSDFLTNKTLDALGSLGLISEPKKSSVDTGKTQSNIVDDYFDKGGYTV